MGEIDYANHTFYIKVTHNKDTGEYTATWGTKTTQTAFSAATALRMLADEFDALDVLGSGEERLRQYSKTPDILCKYCKAPIFFAVLTSGKYLAFDTEPVEGGEMGILDRCATFPKSGQTRRGPKPLASFNTGPRKGPVFVPHPNTCGGTVMPPTCAPLLERWTQNRTVTQAHVDRAIAGLRHIRQEIAEGALDDPNEVSN